MQDEINRLHEMLTQLPPDQQERVVPKLIDVVAWLLEKETDDATGADSSSSIGISFSRTRSVRRAGFY